MKTTLGVALSACRNRGSLCQGSCFLASFTVFLLSPTSGHGCEHVQLWVEFPAYSGALSSILLNNIIMLVENYSRLQQKTTAKYSDFSININPLEFPDGHY
jgi:hypothetical protein